MRGSGVGQGIAVPPIRLAHLAEEGVPFFLAFLGACSDSAPGGAYSPVIFEVQRAGL